MLISVCSPPAVGVSALLWLRFLFFDGLRVELEAVLRVSLILERVPDILLGSSSESIFKFR